MLTLFVSVATGFLPAIIIFFNRLYISLLSGGRTRLSSELNSKRPVTVYVNGSKTIKIQSIWNNTPTSSQERQTIFIFGTSNGLTVYGLISLFSNTPEASRFDGEGNVEVALDSQGIITVTLPQISWDRLVLISGDPIRLL